ncbi:MULTISPECIES: alpha/beta hydrolase [Janthinobacterium]|nr:MULTISPECIES: alpha/beta hydrolase [Janthinobacterium]
MLNQQKCVCLIKSYRVTAGPLSLALLCSVLSACASLTPPASISTIEPAPEAPATASLPPPPPPPPPPRSAPAPPPVSGGLPAEVAAQAGSTLVRVYYATDRQFQADKKNYSWQPNRKAPHLSYGSVLVSVPEDRKIGTVTKTPWWILGQGGDARKYMLIMDLERWSAARFFATVKTRLAASLPPERRAAFIYIHGYYNAFDDAALRTAQMAVDLNVNAMPVFYSWPSKGEFTGYRFDDNSAQWTQAHLQNFLADFADRSDATDIYIIAHSMGNRPTTMALANLLEKRPELLPRFKQVVLAAPDINADVFREQIAPRLASLGLPVTLYASKNDMAMRLSYRYSGWDKIGDIRGPIVNIPGLDFIDASNVTMNFIGHDYLVSNRVVLTDVATMIKAGLRAKDRGGLRGRPLPVPRYWEFP